MKEAVPDAAVLRGDRDRLGLTSTLESELGSIARAAYPEEACGLLVSGSPPGAVGPKLRALALPNRAASGRDARFEIAPADFRSAQRAAQRSAEEIAGVFHSHPNGSPEPSRADDAEAWPGYLHLIVALSADRIEDIRVYQWDPSARRLHATGVPESGVREGSRVADAADPYTRPR